MNKIRVAVIGAGFFGERHVNCYAALPDVTLSAVIDTDIERARRLAAPHGCQAFSTIEKLSGTIDAASIVTPTASHADIARRLLLQGIDILIEKPITATVAEAEAMDQLAQSQGRIVQVGHIEQFNPAILKVKEQITRPRFIECHRMGPYLERAANVSVIMDLMIHDIDLVLSLVALPVVKIDAVGIPILSREVDLAQARIAFADGAVANLTASRVSEERFRALRVIQEGAYLSLDYLRQTLVIRRLQNVAGDVTESHSITTEKQTLDKGDALCAELSAFIQSVRTRQRPVISCAQGKAALSVALQIADQIHRAPTSF